MSHAENGKNGIFLKVIVGALAGGLIAATGGLIKLYRDVGILQSSSSLEKRVDTLEKRIDVFEALTRDIASDRDKRTIIIQGFREDIADIKRRLELIENRRR